MTTILTHRAVFEWLRVTKIGSRKPGLEISQQRRLDNELAACCVCCSGVYKGLCSLSVTGADKHVPLLSGGLDGKYKLHHCEGGRPAYVREKSPPARAH